MIGLESIKKAVQNLTVRTVTLFLLGGAIQVGPILVLLFDLTGNPAIQKLDQTETYVLTVFVFLLGVSYCVFASLAFTPKRFFTPTFLHLSTWSFLSPVLLADIILVNVPFGLSLASILSLWFTDVIYAAMLLALVAIGQFFIVRFFVGRNGTESDIVRIGFEIPLPLAKVLDKVENVGDHPYLSWEKHLDRGTHHTFKMWVSGSISPTCPHHRLTQSISKP